MANIREFDAPADLGLTPTDRGHEANLGAAQRIAGLYSQAGNAITDTGRRAGSALEAVGQDVVQFVDQKDRSDISLAATGKLAQLDKDWLVTKKGNGLDPNDPDYIPPADPNDPSIAEKFVTDKVEPAIADLGSIGIGLRGRDFAEAKIEQLREHFTQKTTADMVEMAGSAALLKDKVTTNNLSNLVTTSPDFHSVDMALQMHKDATAGWQSNPNISTQQLAVLNDHFLGSQTAIVHAAAFAAVSQAKDPEAVAAAFSKRYPDYIRGDEALALAKAAVAVQKSNLLDQNRAIKIQKQQQQDASDARETEYLQKLHDDDPAVAKTVTAKGITLDPTLTRESKERMLNIVKREIEPETDARISAQTSVGIIQQLRDPNFDPEKVRAAILDARGKPPGTPGSLTKADMADLQKQVDDVKTPQGAALAGDRNEFFKQYGPTIDPEMKLGNPTPLGAQGLYRAEKDARRQEQVLRAKGIDPHSLYDPSSEYFLGKPDRIGSYRPSLADKAAFDAQLKADAKRPASVNLTADGSTVTGIQTLEIPAGMSPTDAIKWAKDQGAKSGAKVKLPDGRFGTVP